MSATPIATWMFSRPNLAICASHLDESVPIRSYGVSKSLPLDPLCIGVAAATGVTSEVPAVVAPASAVIPAVLMNALRFNQNLSDIRVLLASR